MPWLFGLGVSGAIAQYLLTEAYRMAPPSLLSSFEYTAMIWALALGYLLWGDWPGAYVSHWRWRGDCQWYLY